MSYRTQNAGLVVLFTVAIVTGAAAQGKGGGNGNGGNPPGKCQDVPIRITLMPLNGGTPSVLAGDSSGDTYEDGANGVSASIHFCSATRDATITTFAGTREIQFSFPAAAATLDEPAPDWAPGTFVAPFFFNIRNILCHDGSCGNPFTTRMNWRFERARANYRLRFYPYDADSPDLHSPDMAINEPDINLPYETSNVSVFHQPGNCPDPGTTHDKWDVIANNLSPNGFQQLGTLHLEKNRPKDPSGHRGQFEMPYRLQVEALRCFEWETGQ